MKKLTNLDPELIVFTGKQESQYLMTKDTWRDSVIDLLSGNVVALGDFLPWSKTHDYIRLRPGEVSLWAGINGHMKSMLTGQVALWLSRNNRVCIASLEMRPEKTLERMIRQASGAENPSIQFADKFLTTDTENLWIYDQLDSVAPERIIGVLHYAAQKLDIKHVFIDSLVKCGIGTDDYNGQKEFIDRLCWVAKSENIHVHLVHHIRKGDKDYKRPTKNDVKGAGELTDLVDNVFIVFKNKQKEFAKRSGDKYDEKEPDMSLIIEKQRNDEWEGPIYLWLHNASLQHVGKLNAGPMPWPGPGQEWSFTNAV